MLKAKKPEIVVVSKPKFLISGNSGVGKTFFALDFPNVYYIDVEGGAVRNQYREKLSKNNGVYFGKEEGSQDYQTVLDEIKALSTEKHEHKTLVIDSFTKLYNIAAAKAEAKGGSDFGRDKKEANRPTRQLMMLLDKIDMTVILICHSKIKWNKIGNDLVSTGTTFDGYDKLEFDLDLWIEILKSKQSREFLVKKSRITTFPEGECFKLDYSVFSDMYGADIINKKAEPVVMADEIQVKRLNDLIAVLKVEDETIEKWKSKANVSEFSEMTSADIKKCIDFLEKKLDGINSKEDKKNGKSK